MASSQRYDTVDDETFFHYCPALRKCDLVKGEILFLGKMSLLLFCFLFLTQTVDFSSPGPKEFDYFCFLNSTKGTL